MIQKLLKLFKKKPRNSGQERFICNLKPDPKDERDYVAKAIPEHKLPSKISFRKYTRDLVKQQGRIGSCGSHAFATAIEIMLRKYKPDWFIELSERFHYYVVRQPEFMNTYPRDSGQYLRMGAKVLHKVGISPEVLCPYDWRKYNEKPNIFAYGFARWWKIKSYQKCYDIQTIKSELADGLPVIFGARVYESFLKNRDGLIKFPTRNDKYAGGHAMVIIGYDDEINSFEVINSWGKMWGRYGYCWIPYDWMKEYMLDAWTISIA